LQDLEDTVLGLEEALYRRRGKNEEVLEFPQVEKAHYGVNLGRGEKNARDRERPGVSGEGDISGAARSLERRSGEAPTRNQRLGRGEKAIWVCERGRVRREPLRNPEQLRQEQFHCGNPPSAAEPRILMCIQQAFWLDR